MDQPMFYQGQRVVFVGIPYGVKKEKHILIEGKSYYVLNPCITCHCGCDEIYISLAGITTHSFMQKGFVPYDTDRQLEEQIHESLKGIRIEN